MTPGQAADCRAAETLLTGLPKRCIVLADRAYDTNPVRQLIEGQGAAPNISSKVPALEELLQPRALQGPQHHRAHVLPPQGVGFAALRVRRLATRYDKLAANFLASVHLAAAITWWLSVLTLAEHELAEGAKVVNQ